MTSTKIKERDLQERVMEWCEGQPNVVVFNVHQSGWTGKGFPDLILCVNGQAVYVELKVGKNQMEPAQRIWRKRILRAGGKHIAPYSFEEFLKEIEKWLQ